MITSAIFSTEKGRRLNKGRRTICEVHRQLFDLLSTREGTEVEVALLEEAFIDGVKLVERLVAYKENADDFFPKYEPSATVIQLRELRNNAS